MLKIHVLSVHVCAQLLFINIYQKLHCKRSRILNTHENIGLGMSLVFLCVCVEHKKVDFHFLVKPVDGR